MSTDETTRPWLDLRDGARCGCCGPQEQVSGAATSRQAGASTPSAPPIGLVGAADHAAAGGNA